MNNPFEQKTPLDFQSIIFSLQTYWANQGALIWQPYYSQVGAGTMNPATFLRVLGPEPWKVAYVEPSVRPDDGRYGVNPNRLQQHYQFQVILKPDPGNPQQLYLDSLKALGIDPNQHDIRFVEDNWESPALSAWGLGWEVWLDGQEITQFTYFQQAGGIVLGVPSVEITYGLERIAMALQKVRDFKQIRWNSRRTYGDVNQVAEREHSTYYFEIADVDRLHQMFNLLVEEATLALENGLVLPAYDCVIKCSHMFNVLDARGAVGFTERQALFGKMRDLSRQVAEAYLAQRQEMEFPWLEASQPALELERSPLPVLKTETADMLLEIGTEELPTADLDSALVQLEEGMGNLLLNARLGHGEVRVSGTPRRLVVYIENLQTKQTDRVSIVKGPPADRAYDAEGKPTKAAEGFARSRGLDTSQLTIRSMDGGDYVVAEVAEKGKPAIDVLSEMFPDLCNAIRFSKAMRWNETGAIFSRPVRWLTALLGEHVIPFSFAGLLAGRLTFGLRFYEKTFEELSDTQAYLQYIAEQGIVLDPEQRRLMIWDQATNLAQKTGGTLAPDPDLLAEVANLVEKPTALLGSFEERYLETLPPEVLMGVMKKHQRYFPVLDKDGNLTQHFIVIRNGGDQFAEMVIDGNLQVIHARFADADFFIREDRERPLELFVPKLAQLTFQKQLGSMLEKNKRVQSMAREIADRIGLEENLQSVTDRTALLCKADLATAMVVEMTELQGFIGKYYAQLAGENEAVSNGIFEHYLPRNSEDILPSDWPGLVVGIADRLDSIAGLFAVGLVPTGNKDPFALRRIALGLIQLLIGKNLDFDLDWGLERAGSRLPVLFSEQTKQSALDFIGTRMRGSLLEKGFRYDVIDAVLRSQTSNPAAAARAIGVLSDWVAREDWGTILPAYSRCVRITREQLTQFPVDPKLFTEKEEKILFKALVQAEGVIRENPGDLTSALRQVSELVPAINVYFDRILVMSEDEKLRQSRLGLLQRIAKLILPLADFSALEGF